MILGASSPIARAVRAVALQTGHEVLTAGRRNADLPVDVLNFSEHAPAATASFGVIDAVISAAAAGSVALATEVNGAAGEAAVEFASMLHASHVVHLSTIYAADPARYSGPREYPESKLDGERRARERARELGRTLSVLRPSHVYGTDPSLLRRQPLLEAALERSQHNETFVLRGAGETRRDYLHIDDLTTMILAAAEQQLDDTVDCGSPQTETLRANVETIYRARDFEPNIRFDASETQPPDSPTIDRERSARLLGVRAEIEIERGLTELVTAGATA